MIKGLTSKRHGEIFQEACHTLKLSVNVYLKSPGVCDVVQKLKGITTFLHSSGHRLTNLKRNQKRLDLEETRPPKTGNSVRWSYTHQSQEWFRKSQPAILMYDVTHGHEEGHNDGAYSDNKLHHNRWKLNTQSLCVSLTLLQKLFAAWKELSM